MTEPAYQWFRRFGDIPGIDWAIPDGIDRTRLAGHDATPEPSTYRSDDFWWPVVYSDDREELEEGETSASPASQYPMPDGPRTVAEQLHALGEALELPGTAQDYDQLLADAAQYLYKIRRREPAALQHAERLCLLDIELLSLRGEVLDQRRDILSDVPEDQMPVWVGSVRLLHRMYTENGALEDAERIAMVAIEQLGQRFDRELGETRERLAVLRSEDA